MKKTKPKHTKLIAVYLLLLALLPVSCKKDNYAVREKATLTMTFSARAGSSYSKAEDNLLANELMQTLRVIVARQNGEILYNVFYDDFEINPDGIKYKTITFGELTVNENGEDIDFYAIANERAFLENNESLEGENINLQNLKSRILVKDFNQTPLSLLPQAGFKTIKVGKNENPDAEMKLQFPVGKIQLIFDNQTNENVSLTNVKLAGVAPSQGFLFKDENLNVGLPSNTLQTGDIIFGNSGAIDVPVVPASDLSPFIRYIYPGEKSQGDYKLSAEWNGHKEVVLESRNVPISSISYGQQFNIRITLKSNDMKVSLYVLPWNVDETNIDFSTDFSAVLLPATDNAIKVTGSGDDKAIAVATGHDGKNRNPFFSFKMVSPVGARWNAHLENTVDFKLEGITYGYGSENSEEALFSVVPLRNYDATNPQSVKLFITVDSSLGGTEDEGIQIINPGKDDVRRFPGNDTEIEIIQVGETAYDKLTEYVNKN